MTDEEFANLFKDDNDEQVWLTVEELTRKANDLPQQDEPPTCQHQKMVCCKCGELFA